MQDTTGSPKHEYVILQQAFNSFRKICNSNKNSNRHSSFNKYSAFSSSPLMLGCFLPALCILGAGLAVDSLFGNANIANDASIKRPDISTKPRGQLPIKKFTFQSRPDVLTQPPGSHPTGIRCVDFGVHRQVGVHAGAQGAHYEAQGRTQNSNPDCYG